MEDPSDGFIALRDMLDCQNCQTLSIFQPPLIHQPFTEATAKLAREKFKINKVKLDRVLYGLIWIHTTKEVLHVLIHSTL